MDACRPKPGARALENLENRNVTIVTVGTGSARNGVVERIVGGERAVVHPKAEALMPRVFEPEKSRQFYLDFDMPRVTKFEPEKTASAQSLALHVVQTR